MRTDELDFQLPPELIAQVPATERAQSRLMHYRRAGRSIAHRTFTDLPCLLRTGDLLVFNDARVIPARFMLQKQTGGRVEGLFLSEVSPGRWSVLLKNLGATAENTVLRFLNAPDVTVRVVRRGDAGEHQIEVSTDWSAVD